MSQDCPDQATLRAFAVGQLAGPQFEQVAHHLPNCTVCEAWIDEAESRPDDILDGLRRMPEQPVAPRDDMPDFAETIVQSLESGSDQLIPMDHGKRFSRLLKNGECRLGRFELLEEVGCGSFGHVFRARDRELDRLVAVKIQRAGSIASPQEQSRFLHEARSVARLQHPSIVALYETGETEDGVCYLVTEYVGGETLESRLKGAPFDYHSAATFVLQLAEALHYAHQEGIVHRDVKPSNILIDESGAPHLADFGLAKRESTDASLTTDGRVMGTPAYMPPEHARGCSRESDARSDTYSLGVILYEMLTGERPFQGTRRLLLLQVLDEEPRPPRQLDDQIPRDLETICLKAMAKQPGKRYQTGQELADDVGRFLNGDPILARPIGYLEKLQRWSAKYPFAVALFGAIIFSSIAGFLYLRSLNAWIVKEMALDNVRLYSDMMEEFNEYYSEIRGSFFPHGAAVSEEPPLPATMRIELAQRISCNDEEFGMQARVFSPYSFRKELRPRDEFEKATLLALNQRIADDLPEWDESLEFYRFVTIDEQPYLKYARGQLMSTSCVECHNSHPNTPRHDWKVGDLAGVFSLTRPLAVDVERTQEGFRGASLLVLAVSLALTVGGLVLAVRTRR